ncbi:hypothetical protein CUMW_149230 [Citrus unshiu]|nr:hypothetical protein CUMW_149230 [Citrus unshiu]GAY53437.1 hypothetical protein CUMW_149230 [Citrus unshiu]
MSLTIANTAGSGRGSRILYTNPTTDPQHRRHGITFPTSTCSSRITRAPFRTLHVVSAAKKLSSRTGRFDSKNRRGNTGAITTTEEDKKDQQQRTAEIGQDSTNINNNKFENAGVIVGVDGSPMPELPGLEPDFWEGPQWGAFGFFLQYLWAFGIVFALVACGIAVATYNEGATDFKETPAYKESVQSRDLLEGPDASNSDVFESNPTEVAPSLD